MAKNPHIGSSLDDFLRKDGILEECMREAKKKVKEWKKRETKRKSLSAKLKKTSSITKAEKLAVKSEFVKIFDSDFDEALKFTVADWKEFLSGSYLDSTEFLTSRKRVTE